MSSQWVDDYCASYMRIPRIVGLLLALFLLVIIVGCSNSQEIRNEPTKTSSPYVSKTLSKTPIQTGAATSIQISNPPIGYIPTNTAIPTFSSNCIYDNSCKSIIETLLIRNHGCKYPCVWGIVTGVTGYQEAQKLLSGLFEYKDYVKENDYGVIYSYFGYLREAVADLEVKVVGQSTIDLIMINIDYMEDPRWDKISKFNKLAQLLSMQSIFIDIGQPDEIRVEKWLDLMSSGNNSYVYRLYITYNKIGVLFRYWGIAEEINDQIFICPHKWNKQNYLTGVGIISAANKAGKPLDEILYKSSFGRIELSDNLSRITNTTTEEFYKGILSNPHSCIIINNLKEDE